jgi:ASC-1-like (ASCH) protein
MPNYHLAILKKPYLDAILEGRKPVESRFTITKRSPFGQIFRGDKVFLKQSSGPVCATAVVSAVKSFPNLTPEKVFDIKAQYNHLILGSDEHWQHFSQCNFGLLIWLNDIKLIEPVMISKKDWRAWVVLNNRENYGLLRNP